MIKKGDKVKILTGKDKKKLDELTRKYKDLEHEFDRLYEENQNIRLVRNKGKVL